MEDNMNKPICDKCNVVMTFGRNFGCLSCKIIESGKVAKPIKSKMDSEWYEYAVNGHADEWR